MVSGAEFHTGTISGPSRLGSMIRSAAEVVSRGPCPVLHSQSSHQKQYALNQIPEAPNSPEQVTFIYFRPQSGYFIYIYI